MFTPKYTITYEIAQYLMNIQKASTIVEIVPLPSSILTLVTQKSSTS